ncbi:M56 family metallopeptidase [Luteolibacter sp. GHJ8]|uniref:M56 family metallopeptidase n=1 Tax=Luteolibacter rhizosphaerae TaxID=2989719 RepID=A0ABT3G5E1_9BACT|nr:M56 family metallopeptidase [Luteolibacter rhizosphaerae]MCW1915033.1 M56 family metallopeptidase [Luteolibacter rhizosphaerae]
MTLSPYLMTVALHALLLSAAVALLLACFRTPARRSALALAGVIAVAILPWFSALLPTHTPEPSAPLPLPSTTDSGSWRVFTIPADDFTIAPTPDAGSAPSFTLPSAWTLAAWAWPAGSVIALLAIACSLLKLHRWSTSFREPRSDEASLLASSLPPGLALGQIRLTAVPCSPCVTGFIRPLLVIPSALLDSSSARELLWILRHEQGHLIGHDSRWTLLIALSRALFWWNPFIHHLAGHWAAAREEVCDLHAETAERSGYGNFLIRLATACKGSHRLAAPMASGAKRRLRKRLVSFLNAPETISLRVGRPFIAILAMALPVLALCSSCVHIGGKKEQVATSSAGMPPLLLEAGKDRKGSMPNLMVKLSNKVLATATPLTFNGVVLDKSGTVLTSLELQLLMRQAATMRGAMLRTFPAISIRNGEKAVIEMIREKPPVPGEERITAGWELNQTIRYNGKSLRLGNHIRYAFVPDKQFSFSSQSPDGNEAPLSKSDWNKLEVMTAATEAKVPESHAVITYMGEDSSGLHTILITEVIPIDPTGRTVARYRDAIYSPHPRETLPGKVRVNAALLSGPSLSYLDTSLKDVNRIYSPDMMATHIVGIFTPWQWRLVKKDLKVEDLGPATFSANIEHQPWEKLPELMLAARRYKNDEGLVSLDISVKEPGEVRSGRFIRQALNVSTGTTVIYRFPSLEGKMPRHLALTVETVE